MDAKSQTNWMKCLCQKEAKDVAKDVIIHQAEILPKQIATVVWEGHSTIPIHKCTAIQTGSSTIRRWQWDRRNLEKQQSSVSY